VNIIIFGAAGDVGSRILNEALSRGHNVTAVVRSERKSSQIPHGASVSVADVSNANSVVSAIDGHDVAISALRPPDGQESDLPALTKSVLEAAAQTQTRILLVGGAANLLLPNGSGDTVLTAPNFLPESVKPIAAACNAQFEICLAHKQANWTYFSPPAMLQPGERTGQYRRGTDTLLVDDAGDSKISMEDFAVAMLDEAEASTKNAARITVAY